MTSVKDLARAIYRRLRPRRDHWTHFLSILDGASLADAPSLDPAGQRALFKRNVTLVEIEPHAYCNRTCAFCPNSVIDRLTVDRALDRDLYASVLADLASIDYARVLRFARYSEPMAREHIFDMVGQARRALPGAAIDIVTNGDYLDPEGIARLRDAGLTALRISVYLRRGVAWSPQTAWEEIGRVGQRIGIAPERTDHTPASVGAVFPYRGLHIPAYAHNFDEIGFDRGQLLARLVDHGYVRRSPCFLVFSNFTVDFDGTVMPCCNLRSDHPEHAAFRIGRLTARPGSVFEVYASRAATAWRRSLAGVGDKAAPCATCKQDALDGPALVRIERAVTTRLSALGGR